MKTTKLLISFVFLFCYILFRYKNDKLTWYNVNCSRGDFIYFHVSVMDLESTTCFDQNSHSYKSVCLLWCSYIEQMPSFRVLYFLDFFDRSVPTCLTLAIGAYKHPQYSTTNLIWIALTKKHHGMPQCML